MSIILDCYIQLLPQDRPAQYAAGGKKKYRCYIPEHYRAVAGIILS
jgi:hypothetical protein